MSLSVRIGLRYRFHSLSALNGAEEADPLGHYKRAALSCSYTGRMHRTAFSVPVSDSINKI